MAERITHKVTIYKVDFRNKKLLDTLTLIYKADISDEQARKDKQYQLYIEQCDRYKKLRKKGVQSD